MVGMASTKENSAAVRRSTPHSRAAMIVAPEREVPGTIASTWPNPISTAASGPISSMERMEGCAMRRSITMIAIPPRMSATHTT